MTGIVISFKINKRLCINKKHLPTAAIHPHAGASDGLAESVQVESTSSLIRNHRKASLV